MGDDHQRGIVLLIELRHHCMDMLGGVEIEVTGHTFDRDPAVGGRDGLIPLLIGLAATTSMRENRPVRVKRPKA